MTTPIIKLVCDEPEGDIERAIYPVDLSFANLTTMWEKSIPFKNFLGKEVRDNFAAFVECFVQDPGNGQFVTDSLVWRIDDFVGLYYLTDIRETEATAHFTFFDRRFRGRLKLTKSMLKFLFIKYGFQRLNVEVPTYASPATANFVRMLGFLQEGRKRKAVHFNSDWFDVKTFGILREEVIPTRKS